MSNSKKTVQFVLAQDFSMGLVAKGLTQFDKNGVHLP